MFQIEELFGRRRTFLIPNKEPERNQSQGGYEVEETV